MVIISLVLAVFALFCSVYLYLELQKKLSSEDVVSKLSLASEELSKSYARSFRELETEWADMYQKFSRLAGRVDKNRGLEAAQNPQLRAPELPATGTRSDLLRKHRGGAPS
jgi:hypothetical protein